MEREKRLSDQGTEGPKEEHRDFGTKKQKNHRNKGPMDQGDIGQRVQRTKGTRNQWTKGLMD